MKKILSILLLLVFFTCIITLTTNCKKDYECRTMVTAKWLIDTNRVVPWAYIKIAPNPSSYGHPNNELEAQHVEGETDANGQFEHTFNYEAILDIKVELYRGTDTAKNGAGTIRLKPGYTVNKTIYIQ